MVGYTSGPNASCLPAVAGCVVNFVLNPSICDGCFYGMVLDTDTFKCTQCPLFCVVCSITQICMACYNGYYLTAKSDPVCAPNCQFPCLSCSYLNSSNCYTCRAGYLFNPSFPNNCQPNNTCTGCNVCPAGYALNSSSVCTSCALGCMTCSSLSASSCLSCWPGQYVNNGQCSNCMAGCVNCTNAAYCISCDFGYVQQSIL